MSSSHLFVTSSHMIYVVPPLVLGSLPPVSRFRLPRYIGLHTYAHLSDIPVVFFGDATITTKSMHR